MEIFEQEKSLANLLENTKTVSLVSNCQIIEDREEIFVNSLAALKDCIVDKKILAAIEKIAEKGHPDLLYGSAILASTVMNLNDDVFLPEETWAAKNTPINTPYNDQHVDIDIIGHIINSRVLTADRKRS